MFFVIPLAFAQETSYKFACLIFIDEDMPWPA